MKTVNQLMQTTVLFLTINSLITRFQLTRDCPQTAQSILILKINISQDKNIKKITIIKWMKQKQKNCLLRDNKSMTSKTIKIFCLDSVKQLSHFWEMIMKNCIAQLNKSRFRVWMQLSINKGRILLINLKSKDKRFCQYISLNNIWNKIISILISLKHSSRNITRIDQLLYIIWIEIWNQLRINFRIHSRAFNCDQNLLKI